MSIFRGISSVRGLGQFGSVTAAAAHQNPVPAAGEIVLTTNLTVGKYFGVKEGDAPGNTYQDLYIFTSTGYFKIEWWDGTTQVVSPFGLDYIYMNFNGSISGSSGSFSKIVTSQYDGVPKDVRIYSCLPNGTKSGYIIGVDLSSSSISFLDLSQASSLTHARLQEQYGSYYGGVSANKVALDIILNANITDLDVVDCNMTALDLSGCSSLVDLSVSLNPLPDYSFLDPVRSQLQNLQAGQLSNTYADLSYMTSLQKLWMFNATEEIFDITGCSSLIQLLGQLSPNLTNIYASGVGGAMNYSTYSTYSSFASGFNLSNCNLDAAALDDLYSSLDYGSGIIMVGGNLGTSSDDPTIATAKGFTVYGS
jgi:hypothetical protein